MKKVLIITYYWPPAGGPGVQRVLKFAKYLPQLGWQPIILSVKNGEYPAYDSSLSSEIPNDCIVYKTPAIEPFSLYKKFTGIGSDEPIPVAALTEKKTSWKKKLSHWIRLNCFIPDAKIGWIPYAIRAGKHIIKNEKPDIIFSSSPPPTVHLIAKSLARWSGIKWVADFRDPWTKIYHYDQQRIAPISTFINRSLEKRVLLQANKLTRVSSGFFSDTTSSKMNELPNGFDEDDIPAVLHSKNNVFTIRYMGSMKERQYVDTFYKILKELSQNPLYKNKLRFEIIGHVYESVKQRIINKKINGIQIKFLGYCNHDSALELIGCADMLLFIIGQSSRAKAIVTGKLFEYIMVNKPILAFGPLQGEANRIIRTTGTGKMFEYSDYDNAKKFIIDHFERWCNNTQPEIELRDLKEFSRRNLTEKLIQIFKDSL